MSYIIQPQKFDLNFQKKTCVVFTRQDGTSIQEYKVFFIICFLQQCFNLAEKYEDDIEEWYYNYQDTEPLLEYICRDRYLKHKNWNDGKFSQIDYM